MSLILKILLKIKQFFIGFLDFSLSGLFRLVNFYLRCLNTSFKCCEKEKRYLQIKLAIIFFSIIKNFLKFKPLREKYGRAIVNNNF